MTDFPEITEDSEAHQDAMRDILNDEGNNMAYEISDEMLDRIENNFTYHSPNGDQGKRYEEMREAGKTLAFVICASTPMSREQSVALTKLEEVVMWANASVARNEE